MARRLPLSLNGTFWAYKGIGEYTKPYKFLRVLQAGSENYFGIVTKEKSGIKTLPDLKGKKSDLLCDLYMTQLVMETELQAYGVNPVKDITVVKNRGQFDCDARPRSGTDGRRSVRAGWL